MDEQVIADNSLVMSITMYYMGVALMFVPIFLVALLLRLRLMSRLDWKLISRAACPIDDSKLLMTVLATRRTFFTTRKTEEVFRGNGDNWRRPDHAICLAAEVAWLKHHAAEQPGPTPGQARA